MAPWKRDDKSAAEDLRRIADLKEAKAEEYGDGQVTAGRTLAAMFPDGVMLKTPEDHMRYNLFSWGVAKYTRYAQQFADLGQPDSMDDAAAYAAMLGHEDARIRERQLAAQQIELFADMMGPEEVYQPPDTDHGAIIVDRRMFEEHVAELVRKGIEEAQRLAKQGFEVGEGKMIPDFSELDEPPQPEVHKPTMAVTGARIADLAVDKLQISTKLPVTPHPVPHPSPELPYSVLECRTCGLRGAEVGACEDVRCDTHTVIVKTQPFQHEVRPAPTSAVIGREGRDFDATGGASPEEEASTQATLDGLRERLATAEGLRVGRKQS